MIGAIFNSFYDVNLLTKSASILRSHIDFIIVVHQRVSFFGEPEDPNNSDKLNYMLDRGIINYLLIIEPNIITTSKDFTKEVILKRNKALDICKSMGCDYVLSLDNDEFYEPKGVLSDVKLMSELEIDTLYSKIKSYYCDESHYFIEKYYVPSIFRVDDRSFSKAKSKYLCDPARQMDERRVRLSDNYMHHLTYYKETFKSKGISNPKNIKMFESISNRLDSWNEGDKALIYSNTGIGIPTVKEIELIKSDNDWLKII